MFYYSWELRRLSFCLLAKGPPTNIGGSGSLVIRLQFKVTAPVTLERSSSASWLPYPGVNYTLLGICGASSICIVCRFFAALAFWKTSWRAVLVVRLMSGPPWGDARPVDLVASWYASMNYKFAFTWRLSSGTPTLRGLAYGRIEAAFIELLDGVLEGVTDSCCCCTFLTLATLLL